jgi:hypothetical protein
MLGDIPVLALSLGSSAAPEGGRAIETAPRSAPEDWENDNGA